jgi:thiol-disulfide isomerase/thioredoxin
MPHRARPLLVAARGLAAALFGAVLFAAAPAAAEGPQPDLIPVGTPAPMFESIDTDGNAFTLAGAIKERPVMLVFWSLFCASCMEELPLIEQEQPKFAGKVQVFAVNLDEAPRAKNVKMVAKQKGLTFRMLLNKLELKAEDGTLTKKDFQIDQAFKIKATPALYLVNTDGTVAFAHYGALGPDELAEVVAKAK